jgi:hypothetical protein
MYAGSEEIFSKTPNFCPARKAGLPALEQH